MKNRKTTAKWDPSSPWFVGFMIFFWFMTAYFLLLTLSVAEAGHKDIWPVLISQCLWPVMAVIMTVSRVRCRIRNHLKPHPLRFMKERLLWFRGFLFPVKYRVTEVSGEMKSIEKRTVDFRDEYRDFFGSGKISEHVTQLFRHQLMLHRSRLVHKGVRMEAAWSPVRIDEEPWAETRTGSDGRMRRFQIQEHVKGDFRYSSEGRTLFHLKGFLGADFDLIGAKSKGSDAEDVSFQCPNCGAWSPGKDMVTGCPYCGTAFVMEELEPRVSNYSLFKDPLFDRKIVGMKITGHLNRLAAAAALLEALGFISLFNEILKSSGGKLGWGSLFVILLFTATDLLIFLAALAFNYLVTVPLRLLANSIYKKRQEKRSEELKDMKESQGKAVEVRLIADPEFSLESFLSNVRNKTASIHYADTWQQIEAFAETDLSGYISGYRNIIDYRFGSILLKNYTKKEGLHQAEVIVKARPLYYENGKAREASETVRMKLERFKPSEESNPLVLHSIRCKTCGASLDLAQGNTCPHCGNRWDLRQWDWCITEYDPADTL